MGDIYWKIKHARELLEEMPVRENREEAGGSYKSCQTAMQTWPLWRRGREGGQEKRKIEMKEEKP